MEKNRAHRKNRLGMILPLEKISPTVENKLRCAQEIFRYHSAAKIANSPWMHGFIRNPAWIPASSMRE
jgi:hypothetical protein